MQTDKTSIYIDLQRLLRVLHRASFDMPAKDRIVYMDGAVLDTKRVLASVNSYLGIFKTRDGLARARSFAGRIGRRWLYYCKFDEDTVTVKALPGYGHHDRIRRKYKLKLNRI